jgi:hypothetical protein
MLLEKIRIMKKPKFSKHPEGKWQRLGLFCKEEKYEKHKGFWVVLWNDKAVANKNLKEGDLITIEGPPFDYSIKRHSDGEPQVFINATPDIIEVVEPDEVTLDDDFS